MLYNYTSRYIIIKEDVHTDEILSQERIIIGLLGDIVSMTVLNFFTIIY